MNGLMWLLIIWFVIKTVKDFSSSYNIEPTPEPTPVVVDNKAWQRTMRQQEQERQREERENRQKSERAKKALAAVKKSQTSKAQIENIRQLQEELYSYMEALYREEKAINKSAGAFDADRQEYLDRIAAIDNDPMIMARSEHQQKRAAIEKAELQKKIAQIDRQAAAVANKRTTIASKRASLSSRIAANENRIARLQADVIG